MNATEELILSTPHKQPPTPANPGVRPTYRDVMIDKLASMLQMAVITASGDPWTACAEAAVDELIDRPEREFQAQLAAVVAGNAESDSMGAWAPARAGDWL